MTQHQNASILRFGDVKPLIHRHRASCDVDSVSVIDIFPFYIFFPAVSLQGFVNILADHFLLVLTFSLQLLNWIINQQLWVG